MVSKKKKLEIERGLVFLVLALFPLGVLPRMILGFHPVDLVLLILLLLSFSWPRWAWGILVVGLFSMVMALNFAGFLYWLRLAAVLNLVGVVQKLIREKMFDKELVVGALILVGLAALVIGLGQYLIWPDLRALKAWGWDDHYWRLVGSFLDPGFSGIILVLTLITIAVGLGKRKALVAAMLVIGLGLTYSRASYLALGVAMGYLWVKGQRRALVLGLAILLLILVPLLPRPGGEGVKLTRTASIEQRVANYKEGWLIFRERPLTGVGFNNLCAAKKARFVNVGEHSCGGLDNSLLFVMATMGVLGLAIYGVMGLKIWKGGGVLVRASMLAVVMHSFFHNSLFYLWVMVWLAMLIGIEVKGSK